jgi:hypothetical protein
MMSPMITPRIKPSSFWRHQPGADLFVQDQRQAKLGGFIANLAAMDEMEFKYQMIYIAVGVTFR